jgi:cyclophilin family peptidyl-prolyl cis-trans isomerase
MKKSILFALLIFSSFYSCKKEVNHLQDGIYAKIETNKGNIFLELDYKRAPITVANFITLAEGKNDFVTNKYLKGHPFYDGLKFHRVIKGFVIQAGDPLSTGSGDAGYKFKDEISDLIFDKKGLLAMANMGPGTNSSQFFITSLAAPWLDYKYTIFGQVVDNGMDVVTKIELNDVIKSVTIIRKGEAAKKFNAVKTFYDYFSVESQKQKRIEELEAKKERLYEEKYGKIIEEKSLFFDALKGKATRTSTGLKYIITVKGNGPKPTKDTPLYFNFAGFLKEGYLFDTNIQNVAETFGKFDPQRALQGGYAPIPFQIGKKTGMIPGFIEGLKKMSIGDKAILFIPSHLAYGAGGNGKVIPPYADLIFEIELLDKN